MTTQSVGQAKIQERVSGYGTDYLVLYAALAALFVFVGSSAVYQAYNPSSDPRGLYKADDVLRLSYLRTIFFASVGATALVYVGGLGKWWQRHPQIIVLPIIFYMWAVPAEGILGAVGAIYRPTLLVLAPVLLVYRLGPERLILVSWATLGMLIFASVLLGVADSAYGTMPAGEWRGLFAHKNGFGQAIVVFGLMTVFAPPVRAFPWLIRYLCLGLCLLALLPVNSVAPYIAAGTAIIACGISNWFGGSRSLSQRYLVVSLTVTSALVLGLFAEGVFEYFGRDLTLTGRINFWNAIIGPISEAPLGHGFNSSTSPEVLGLLSSVRGFYYNAIDNAYLVLAYEYGWFAPVIYACWLLRMALRGGQGKRTAGGYSELLVAMAVYCLVLSIVEKGGGPYFGPSFAALLLAYTAVQFNDWRYRRQPADRC